jgi:hypothetical protein
LLDDVFHSTGHEVEKLKEHGVELLDQTPCNASQDALLSEASHLSLKVHNPLKSCMTRVKLGRTQDKLLCEGLNLELGQIIDLPTEGKKQLLSHSECSLQSSSFVKTWT